MERLVIGNVSFDVSASGRGGILIYHIAFEERNPFLGQRMKDSLVRYLAEELSAQGYSQKFVDRVLKKLVVETTPYGVMVKVADPIMTFLEFGTRPRKMYSLKGKVIPIKTPFGVIFRKATEKSLLEGKWRHPGTAGRYHLKSAIVASLQEAVLAQRMLESALTEEIEWVASAIKSLFQSRNF